MIPGGDAASRKYVQSVFDQVKQVAQESMGLYGAPPLQYKDRKQKLARRIAALRKSLEENPPANRRLTDRGREYGSDNAAAMQLHAAPQPLADIRRGR